MNGKKLVGFKFRAQHPVGQFSLDFYCPACKLVVELDGDVHETQPDYDEARTQQLNDYGYHVLRFRNDEVSTDLSSILEQILKTAKELS